VAPSSIYNLLEARDHNCIHVNRGFGSLGRGAVLSLGASEERVMSASMLKMSGSA